MNTRLKDIRKSQKMTQAEFGKEIGVSRDAIATYESGRVSPDQSIRMLICERFSVNMTWLETGEGAPYKEGLLPDLVRILRQYPALQTALEAVIDIMGPEEWEMLNRVVARAIEQNKKTAD